ncbi:MAG: hypothetical protein A2Z97_14150 [Bdellovibrionales bacterium GWB1_52_6]|nr:MAG: hypothetical protein A2Z97_14150 [Bdellovibrionales bacterium GWB1_52_6]
MIRAIAVIPSTLKCDKLKEEYMAKLIGTVIQWALLLGLTGGLVDATISMRKEALRAHQIGLVSLSKLNRSLLARPSKIDAPRGSRTSRSNE